MYPPFRIRLPVRRHVAVTVEAGLCVYIYIYIYIYAYIYIYTHIYIYIYIEREREREAPRYPAAAAPEEGLDARAVVVRAVRGRHLIKVDVYLAIDLYLNVMLEQMFCFSYYSLQK